MQTLYYTTSNFVRHTGNVVDLQEYRRKLALAQEEQKMPEPFEAEGAEELRTACPRSRRSRERRRQGLILDACASMGILVMTLTFTLRILCV